LVVGALFNIAHFRKSATPVLFCSTGRTRDLSGPVADGAAAVKVSNIAH
jgi:hypothetical protein